MRRLTVFIASLVLLAPALVWADGLDSLERFVKGVSSGRAVFTQVVTAPGRDGQAGKSRTSTGTFAFQRPNRFRFVYGKPFEQSIVADGQTLWMHDVDLNQVTARKQALVLGSTPAALIAAAPDLSVVQAEYDLQGQPDKDGLQWVLATPKNKEGQLRAVRVGFRGDSATPTLAVLDILDNFGQRSELRFDKVEVNPALPADLFRFTPPADADVVHQ